MNDQSSNWTVVTKSDKRRVAKRSRRQNYNNNHHHQQQQENQQQHDAATTDTMQQSDTILEMVQKSINDCIENIENTQFYNNLKIILSGNDNDNNELGKKESITMQPRQIVCYGIGNFILDSNTNTTKIYSSNSWSAPLWQLAGAIAIRQYLFQQQQNEDSKGEISMVYYDPCMNKLEEQFLISNNISITSSNEQGKRLIQDNIPTLFYMPHCPRILYTNVIHTNWDHLSKITILGNSLKAYSTTRIMSSSSANNTFTRKKNKKKTKKQVYNDNDGDTFSTGGLSLSDQVLTILEPSIQENSIEMSKNDLDTMPGYFENAFNDTFVTRFAISNTTTEDRPFTAEIEDDGGELI